jgi:hypothetical protein
MHFPRRAVLRPERRAFLDSGPAFSRTGRRRPRVMALSVCNWTSCPGTERQVAVRCRRSVMRKKLLVTLIVVVVLAGLGLAAHVFDLAGLARSVHGS